MVRRGGQHQPEAGGLPPIIPVFPLPGVLLLPTRFLPLNIFEPRYLAMVRDAWTGNRLIGMIQPMVPETGGAPPPLYSVGCVGRIDQLRETADGRLLITLAGQCRFRVVYELPVDSPYREVKADFSAFADDLSLAEEEEDLAESYTEGEADMFYDLLDRFARALSIPLDWEEVRKASLPYMIDAVAMICPFEPAEKQALLEAETIRQRYRILLRLMQMRIATPPDFSSPLQ